MPIISGSGGSAGGSSSPGFEIGYDQITASVNITGTTEATANTIITCAAHTFDGAPVFCQFYCSQLALPTAAVTNQTGVALWEGAAELGLLVFERTDQTANQDYRAVYGAFRFTPTAGSHTYLIKAFTSSITGTPSVVAGTGGVATNVPAFVRFTKV